MRKELEDVVFLLQRYKGAVRRLFAVLGRVVEIKLEGNKIVAVAPNTKSLVRCDHIAHHPNPFEKLPVLQDALQVVKAVERAFETLDHEEAFVLFHRYVDHDFERISTIKELLESDAGMIFVGKSYKQIATLLGKTEKECKEIAAKALERVRECIASLLFATKEKSAR
ncbi:MAG: hypothetical protein QXT58_01920 [Archaeoglobaceae archaeon]